MRAYSLNPCQIRLAHVAVFLGALSVAAQIAHADSKLRVLDDGGQPVPKFEVMVHSPSGGGLAWTSGADGSVSISSDLGVSSGAMADLIVRADGFATALTRFSPDERKKLVQGDASITLSRGDRVTLRLKLPPETTWPKDKLPEAYFDAGKDYVRIMRQPSNRAAYRRRGQERALDFNMLNVRPAEAGMFEFQLDRNSPPFNVAVHIPGFLQSFDAGPSTAANVKQGALEVELPEPASLEINFDPGAQAADERPYKAVALRVLAQLPGESSYISLAQETDFLTSMPLRFTDLPPGNYAISLQTLPKGDAPRSVTEPNPGLFRDSQQLTLRAGQSEKINFQFKPLDLNAFRGNRTAVVRIETANGEPAAGREVAVGYADQHYGLIPVFTGTVPETGEITLKDIADGPDSDAYVVRVGPSQIGRFGFSDRTINNKFTFRCPPEAGDMAPDVELLRPSDGKTVKLSDFRGKLVCLDFWAVWCGPCQPALEKLNKLVAEKADSWQDRVAIVPISCDERAQQATDHLASRGWTHLNTYWSGAEGKLSFNAPAMQAYVINGIPTSVLIDPMGKILWRGHPMSNDAGQTLETRLEAALK